MRERRKNDEGKKEIERRPKTAQSMRGNKNNNKFVKMKKLGLIEEAYKSYCDHQAKGYMRETWCFRKDDFSITWETMETHIKENPSNFPPIQKKIAFIEGYHVWEKVVDSSASGANAKANTASLQMLMRNKFGWDKKDPTAEFNPEILSAYTAFFASIPSLKHKSAAKDRQCDKDLAHQELDDDD